MTWAKPDGAGYITYRPIPLGDGRIAELYLPKDLRHDECERLCAMLRALSSRIGGANMSHKHYWHYLHTVYEGHDGDPDSISVIRWCDCGVKQQAFAAESHRLPKDHDAHELTASESAVS